MKKFVVNEKREEKAKKIEAVLKDFLNSSIRGKNILDIGIGNGEIAEYFTKLNKVYGVDVLDQRIRKRSKLKFKKITSEKLPFKDNFFDIVISNHVIEHVKNQNLHLLEIKRVLKKNGICYLATPNWLFPWETHHKIWLVHYLGKDKYHKYLKKKKLYQEDLNLLGYLKLKKLIKKHFYLREYTHEIIKYPKKYFFNMPLLNMLPLEILKRLSFISQTNAFIIKNE